MKDEFRRLRSPRQQFEIQNSEFKINKAGLAHKTLSRPIHEIGPKGKGFPAAHPRRQCAARSLTYWRARQIREKRAIQEIESKLESNVTKARAMASLLAHCRAKIRLGGSRERNKLLQLNKLRIERCGYSRRESQVRAYGGCLGSRRRGRT